MAEEVSPMINGVTQEQVLNVRRAIQDPMIGGWPLIHWEWVFSTDQHALGVEVIGEWSGFAMPSLPMTVLACFLVSTIYALVPPGRWRTVGKWVVAGLLVVTALSRLYLGQDHPTGILAGVVLGVAEPRPAPRRRRGQPVAR